MHEFVLPVSAQPDVCVLPVQGTTESGVRDKARAESVLFIGQLFKLQICFGTSHNLSCRTCFLILVLAQLRNWVVGEFQSGSSQSWVDAFCESALSA